MIGRLLSGRYKVVEALAAGGMGQTYIAEDTQRPGNPKCVVKQLKPASSNSNFLEIARRLFSREAEILEELGHHDQIPRLLAYFEQEQEFYLIQELVDGLPLSIELASRSCWSEPQVIQLLQEVLSILEFVHSHHVIHRDIKPDNLIRRQQDGKVVLIDFGAVKQIRMQQLTTVGQPNTTIAIGTPGYMPTEQSRGKPRPSSDIYALGMVGIRALTGLMPVELPEDDDGELVWRDRAQVSDELAAILSQMVRHYFKQRYQTATEALQALQPLIVTPPATLIYAPVSVVSGQQSLSQVVSGPYAPKGLNGANGASGANSANGSSNSVINPAAIDELPSATQRIAAPIPETIPHADIQDEPPTLTPPTVPVGAAIAGEPDAPPNSPARHSASAVSVSAPKPTRQWKLVGGAIAAIALTAGLSTLGYRYWQHQQALQQVRTLKTAGQYSECIRQAETIQAGALVGECQLAQAQQLSQQGHLKDAITIASSIASGIPAHQAAQQAIHQWTEQILAVAEKEYQHGKLDTAIAIAQTIPQQSQVAKTAQASIDRWNQEWKLDQDHLATAQEALDQGQWQAAIAAASQVMTPYWKEQAAAIEQAANGAMSGDRPSQTTAPSQPSQSSSSQLSNAPAAPPAAPHTQSAPDSTAPAPAAPAQTAPIFEVPSQSDTPTPTDTPTEQNAPMMQVPDIFSK